MSTKLQPHLLLQQQIKGRFLPTSLNHRSEVALTFSAMDQQTRRPVILKYYQKSEHREIQDQIQRGVMSHAQLRSDYTVPLIDFGVHGQYGGVWCVLSREESSSLTRFVKMKDSLDCNTTCEILIGLCEALAPLHTEGKIHGNLKPNNIFVKDRLVSGLQVLISDILGANICGVHKVNGQRVTYNDPSFFTYEQASGKEINQQTDLGALGLISYFMLNGELPFQGRTNDKILTSVIISSGRIKVKEDNIKGSLAQKSKLANLINQCLAKQGSDRPKNLEEFKNSLQEIRGLEQAKDDTLNSSLSALSQLEDASFSLPNLTPNHSLMNPLGFGHTLSFDAISDQSLNQVQAQSTLGQSSRSLPSTPSSPVSSSSLKASLTGSHKAIITAPPEGFEAESFDSLESFPSGTYDAEQTLMAAPHSFTGDSVTMMGGLSFDQIKDLQSMDISAEAEEADLIGVSDHIPNASGFSSDHSFTEDTRPLSTDELVQLGLRNHEPALSDQSAEDWGDLNNWNGVESESDTVIKTVDALGLSQVDQAIEDLEVDELELDMLLEQAASALENEEFRHVGVSSKGVPQYPSDPDTLSSADMHNLDWNQRSTLFNQALVIPEIQEQAEAISDGLQAQVQQNGIDRNVGFKQDLSHLDLTAKVELPDAIKNLTPSESLSYRFEESSHGLKALEPTDLQQVSDSVKPTGKSIGVSSFDLPELFSSPATSITHERVTDEFEFTERFEVPSNIDDLGIEDFAVKGAKPSGVFPIIEEFGVGQTHHETALPKVRTDAIGGAEYSSAIQELDTQLEFQRPEEIFPDIPEWRSLVDLKDHPIALSKALLSIPLPLSGQLLPFSQFQLEIEGKEHEEGFFIAGRQTNTHIPVVLEPEALDALQESNVVWEPVEQNKSESLRDPIVTVNNEQSSVSKTLLNLLLLVLVLGLTTFGLMQTSGLSLQDLNDLLTGGVNHQVVSRPNRSLNLNPIAKPAQPKADQTQELPSVPSIVDPTNQEDHLSQSNSAETEQVQARSELKPKPAPKRKVPKRSKTKRKRSKSKSAKGLAKKKTAKNKKSSRKRSKKRRRKKKSAIKDPFAN